MRDWPEQTVVRYGRAIFVDRDGTIVRDTHYPHRIEELAFESRALEGMRLLAQLPAAILVVSNQAGIAKGLFTREQMSLFNLELRRRVERAGGRIDAIYYCPHLEAKDTATGTAACACSKPGSGMLQEAALDFHLNLPDCYLVGDKNSDIAAGQAVGAQTVLLRTGKAGQDGYELRDAPAVVVADMTAAAEWIRDRFAVMRITG
jgi:D-glycero-D-manno-heptose 1,7-bisphosphate phosphatase